ncbi:hypothetical protein ILUMI_11307 [Ignelater luminosus]|uniref:Uncharacterized protein n=1 Tax=Ignelater luminosus TaxID=2038154 RepID=A0A8K0GE26_IGNLU|nr:hypothetical protein ILUMI_11307 [Ignelater luminosus]
MVDHEQDEGLIMWNRALGGITWPVSDYYDKIGFRFDFTHPNPELYLFWYGSTSAKLYVDGLYIEPPEPSIFADEDAAGEEDNYKIEHLSGRQLAANVEIVLQNSDHIENKPLNEDQRRHLTKQLNEIETEVKIYKFKAGTFYNRKREAKRRTKKEDNFEVITTDYSKNLPTPNITTNDGLEDKAWKLRSLMDKPKQWFLENSVPEEHISYEETIMKYFGRHECKQFICKKRIEDIRGIPPNNELVKKDIT